MAACRRFAALGCVVSLAAASDALAQDREQIAYTGNPEITVISTDGTGRERITKTAPGYYHLGPAWSPDGTTLAFIRQDDTDYRPERRETAELKLVDVSSGVSRTVANDATYGAPSFSPDGTSIVYGAQALVGGEEYTTQLRVISAAGSDKRSLFPDDANIYDNDPAWSPDGSTIAFSRSQIRGGQFSSSIWTVPASGGTPRKLIANASEPAWSPDGTQLAFTSSRDRNGEVCFHECGASREIYVAGPDGSNIRRVTRTKADEATPAWSPDGSQIAFASGRPGPEDSFEIYVMRNDGSCTTRLTNTSVGNDSPAWRPGSAYSAPLVCGGAAVGALMPIMETDLRPARRFRRFPLAWVGRTYRGLLLAGLAVSEFVTFVYDDCGRTEGRCSPGELQVQTSSICRRDPLVFGGYFGPGESDMSPHARRYRRVGDALLADYPSGVDIYSGRITVTLYEPSWRAAAAIARKLDVFPGSRSALVRPRFNRRTLARVRNVREQLRRHGMRELSRRWRMSPEQIRAAMKLRNVLRPSERRGGRRCPDVRVGAGSP